MALVFPFFFSSIVLLRSCDILSTVVVCLWWAVCGLLGTCVILVPVRMPVRASVADPVEWPRNVLRNRRGQNRGWHLSSLGVRGDGAMGWMALLSCLSVVFACCPLPACKFNRPGLLLSVCFQARSRSEHDPAARTISQPQAQQRGHYAPRRLFLFLFSPKMRPGVYHLQFLRLMTTAATAAPALRVCPTASSVASGLFEALLDAMDSEPTPPLACPDDQVLHTM